MSLSIRPHGSQGPGDAGERAGHESFTATGHTVIWSPPQL